MNTRFHINTRNAVIAEDMYTVPNNNGMINLKFKLVVPKLHYIVKYFDIIINTINHYP